MRAFLLTACCTLFFLGAGTGYTLREDALSLACEPSLREQIVRQSLDLAVQRKWNEALEELNSVQACQPQSSREEVLKAQVYKNAGDIKSAEKFCSTAIQIDPYDAEAFGLRGQIYFEQRKFALALRDLDRSLELEPGVPDFEETRNLALYEMGLAPAAPVPEERGPASRADVR